MERKNPAVVDAFAHVLKECRAGAGMSQEDLAGRTELSARHISFLETGARQPSLTVLVALAAGLEISLAELCTRLERAMRGVDRARGDDHEG